MDETFDDRYPNIAWWCQEHEWIEVGSDEFSSGVTCVLDIGGMLWEGDSGYETVGEAMEEADEFTED